MNKRPDGFGAFGAFGAFLLLSAVVVIVVMLIGHLVGCQTVIIQQDSPGASGMDPTIGTEVNGAKPKEVRPSKKKK